MSKKILAALLAVLMVLTLVPMTALAAEETMPVFAAESNAPAAADDTPTVDGGVATVKTAAALNAALATEGVTAIKLGESFAISESLTISKGITIDLNGKVLTSSASGGPAITVASPGSLIVQDSTASNSPTVNEVDWSVAYTSGSIKATGLSGNDGYVIDVAGGGSFTLQSGTIESNYYGIRLKNAAENGGKASCAINGGYVYTNEGTIAVFKGSELNITGGVVHSKDDKVISSNGTHTNGSPAYGPINVNIFGGSVIADITDGTLADTNNKWMSCGVYVPTTGTVTMSGNAVVYSKAGAGMVVLGGDVKIAGERIIVAKKAEGDRRVADFRNAQSAGIYVNGSLTTGYVKVLPTAKFEFVSSSVNAPVATSINDGKFTIKVSAVDANTGTQGNIHTEKFEENDNSAITINVTPGQEASKGKGAGQAVTARYEVDLKNLKVGDKISVGGVELEVVEDDQADSAAGKITAEWAKEIGTDEKGSHNFLNAAGYDVGNVSYNGKILTIEKNFADATTAEAWSKGDGSFKMGKTVTISEEEAAEANKNAGPGKALTLQIGDTSDSYNQVEVSIGDMHTKALGIGDLDISNPTGASAAIATIKNAINQVSSVRGDLGATQNRLEHTANNLSVMAENIQDAESTIRDTDVAEEMMAYTKNNILIQSAQAMLAQANAVPQGVLQLLG